MLVRLLVWLIVCLLVKWLCVCVCVLARLFVRVPSFACLCAR